MDGEGLKGGQCEQQADPNEAFANEAFANLLKIDLNLQVISVA